MGQINGTPSSTRVKQAAHFQNNNLSTFKIRCVQVLHSSNCLHTWNRANADELCKACTVAFCTMYGQKSRCVQDSAALPARCTGTKKDRLRAVKPSQSRSARQLSRRASFLTVRQSYPQQKKLPLSGKTSPGRGKMAKPKGGAAGTASAVTERVYLRVYFFSCCSCSLRSSRMRFFSLLTWGHGQLKPSLALHQRVSG